MARCLWEQGVTIPNFHLLNTKAKKKTRLPDFQPKNCSKAQTFKQTSHLTPWHFKTPGGFNIQHGWKHQFHPPSLPPKCSRIEQDAELKGPDAQNEGTDCPATMCRKVLLTSVFCGNLTAPKKTGQCCLTKLFGWGSLYTIELQHTLWAMNHNKKTYFSKISLPLLSRWLTGF